MEKIHTKPSNSDREVINSRLNSIVLKEMKPVSLGLAVLYFIFSITHYFILTGRTQVMMTVTAAVTTVFLVLFYFGLRKVITNPDNAHLFGSLIAFIVVFNGILHLYLSGDPMQTTNLALLVLGVGFLFLSTPWYLFVISVTTVSWVIVAISSPEAQGWSHFGFFMFSSIVLSIIIHIARKQTRIHSEKIRLSEVNKSQELNRTIQKLEESQAKYRDLFENANDLIQSVNAQGKYDYVNKAWEDVMGYDQEDRKNLTFLDTIHEDSKEKCGNLFIDVSKGQSFQNIETVFVSKSGKKIIVEGSISPQIKDGKFISTRAIFRDITERKKAEEELKRLHEELKTVNERLKEAYTDVKFEKDVLSKVIQDEEIAFITDSDGNVTAITEKARNICGKSRMEVLQTTLVSLFEDDDQKEVKEALRLANIKNFHSVDATLKTEKPSEIEYVVNIMKLNTLKEKQLLIVLRVDTE